ncbi:MAG TPA: cell division protein ZipA C-terminal FtsZ-binding domain-containing protein [Steroidobacteraceae bacterium]|nr:cell division protein ZipA C-terminal FtsZ-binding domain-containing protein [Steroidobacteraceae bacterium]
MAAELRWILLALSLVLLAGIWWWGRRRSLQAPGNSALREMSPTIAPLRSEAYADNAPPKAEAEVEMAEAAELDAAEADAGEAPVSRGRDWGVPPFEPLSIRTQDYDRVPILDGPMMVDADLVPARSPAVAPASAPAAKPAFLATGRVPTLLDPGDRSSASPVQAANASEQQKIVTVRVCAAGEARWSGATLLSALELHGLAYGRYQVFHRRHVDGRSLFCVASLIEPGTFDVTRMSSEEFRGITLFAVLPGPVEPLLTIDELLSAARGLAQELAGMVQDSKGMPLSPQRAAALRDDVARFQASLPRA